MLSVQDGRQKDVIALQTRGATAAAGLCARGSAQSRGSGRGRGPRTWPAWVSRWWPVRMDDRNGKEVSDWVRAGGRAGGLGRGGEMGGMERYGQEVGWGCHARVVVLSVHVSSRYRRGALSRALSGGWEALSASCRRARLRVPSSRRPSRSRTAGRRTGSGRRRTASAGASPQSCPAGCRSRESRASCNGPASNPRHAPALSLSLSTRRSGQRSRTRRFRTCSGRAAGGAWPHAARSAAAPGAAAPPAAASRPWATPAPAGRPTCGPSSRRAVLPSRSPSTASTEPTSRMRRCRWIAPTSCWIAPKASARAPRAVELRGRWAALPAMRMERRGRR